MKNHNIYMTYYFILLLIPLFSVANNSSPASLQQPRLHCHGAEKSALLHFKLSFLLNCSASSSSFARPKMNSWRKTVSDCCRWDGVKCDKETGHVIGLDLSSSCLYGTLPPNSTLFKLDRLSELSLADNNFKQSQIPSAFGHLSKLTRLNLSKSSFTGEIPFEISKLSSLSLLDLTSNLDLELQFSLSFEQLVRNLSHLTKLHLDGVDISSVVPVSLANLTSLRVLSLSFCNLLGKFPSGILQLPNIESVFLLFNNNLEGSLPEFPSNSPLRILDLGSTSFSGELPTSIGHLVSLTHLNLWRVKFTGSIPFSIGNLTKLMTLNLGGFGNNFIGDLPVSITNLTQLTSLHLSNHCVSPRILGSWLLKLSNLEELELSRNTLCGVMQPSLANLTRLNWLDLGYNQITSPLPSLANLTKLTDLYLYDNQFQGPVIPGWFSNLINLERLSLSSNWSIGVLDPLLQLPHLNSLNFYGINLKFPANNGTTISSVSKFGSLDLVSCNFTEFPRFLSYQDELYHLDLSGNNIAGNIPQWFINATSESLLVMNLGINSITGFEQPQVFLPWSNLEVLSINFNELQGLPPIPQKSLKVYDLSYNQLSGIIHKDFCKASSLVYLDLSENNLSGQIPDCVGVLLGDSLQVLNLLANNFNGVIPRSFTRACQLKMINLSQNRLQGQLPKSLLNCTMLEVLDVGDNHFNDTFPSWLGNLSMLQILVLRHNSFHGTIDSSESTDQFRSLRIIDLSYNVYTGNLPSTYLENWGAMRVTAEDQPKAFSSAIEIQYSAMGTFYTLSQSYQYEITITNKGHDTLYTKMVTVFRVIDFSSNNFNGEIPDSLGSLKGLQGLNLSNNHLVGGVPSALGSITDLESLDLSRNMLSGEIPQQLTELTFLEVFNVSHNRLVGHIPQGAQFNTFDNSSYDGNLALCGGSLSNKCGKAHSPQAPAPPSMTNDEAENSELIDWIVRLLGCASGLIVGFLIGIYITDPLHDWFMDTFGRKRVSKTRARRSGPNR